MMSDPHLVSLTDPSVIERLTGARPIPKAPNAKDFVRAYADAIKAARGNGWTVEQIHAELESAGVRIEVHTLRKYVSDLCGPVRKRRKQQTSNWIEAISPTSAAAGQTDPTAKPRSLRRSLAGKNA